MLTLTAVLPALLSGNCRRLVCVTPGYERCQVPQICSYKVTTRNCGPGTRGHLSQSESPISLEMGPISGIDFAH